MNNKNEMTDLLNFTINPSFLELIKQPIESVKINPYLCLDFKRGGKVLHLTIYSGDSGQVNISKMTDDRRLGSVIISDYCKTPKDLKNMFDKLDDLLTRMP